MSRLRLELYLISLCTLRYCSYCFMLLGRVFQSCRKTKIGQKLDSLQNPPVQKSLEKCDYIICVCWFTLCNPFTVTVSCNLLLSVLCIANDGVVQVPPQGVFRVLTLNNSLTPPRKQPLSWFTLTLRISMRQVLFEYTVESLLAPGR